MKTTKQTVDELKSKLFTHRRYHEAGNRRDCTVEQWQKRERNETLAKWIGAIVFTPIFIALWSYISHHYGTCDGACTGACETVPWWLFFSWMGAMLISMISCMSLFVVPFLRPRPCYGRWIVAFDGIFYRYGKSPHRFVPFASLRNHRVEKPKSGFAVIVFDTNQEPLRIAKRADGDGNPIEFLPFLNYLIDRLAQNGRSNADLKPLLELQRVIRRRPVWRHCFQYTEYLMMACYFAPLLCVLPFYSFFFAIPYPAILWILALCVLIVCVMGLMLNSRLERWKNKRIDAMINLLAQNEN
jgi:hypothetical protein